VDASVSLWRRSPGRLTGVAILAVLTLVALAGLLVVCVFQIPGIYPRRPVS
jgi:hypothetical protein